MRLRNIPGSKDVIADSRFVVQNPDCQKGKWAEVFKNNPHRAKYTEADKDIITTLFKESGLSISAFSKTPQCYVGYGTLYKMIKEPEFYNGK